MNSNGKQLIKDLRESRQKAPLPGLYVHWPYCVSKCPYCDFNSHVRQVFDEREYVTAICAEIDYLVENADDFNQAGLGSIFFGGGTPSLMHASTVAAILDHARRRFSFSQNIEITLEANPSSVEAERFAALAEVGVNRVSLGVQALDDEALKVLGRAHGVSEALGALKLARGSFSRSSFDLIYGRHGQSLSDWREELKRGIDLSEGHLSLYQLTIEEGTQYKNLFDRGELNLPSNDRAARFFHQTREMCDKAGLTAYEISNYAKPGQQSAHNLVYWRYGTYLGVGPGAHGRFERGGERLASAAIRSPKRWMAQVLERGHGFEAIDVLSQSEQADEMVLMGMRLREGLDLARLFEVTGHEIDPQKIGQLEAADLCRLSPDDQYLRATDAGIGVLNQIVEQLSVALQTDSIHGQSHIHKNAPGQ